MEIQHLNCTEILSAKGGLCRAVEGFDVCPFETNHIEGKRPLIAYPDGILAQPTFQTRAQISKRKGARRTSREIGFAHGFEQPAAKNSAQTRKIFDHA